MLLLLLLAIIVIAILLSKSSLMDYVIVSEPNLELEGFGCRLEAPVNNAVADKNPREEKDHFLLIWNGDYTIPGGKLTIKMKDQDHGIIYNGTDHWLVRSYGPTILTGDSYDKSTSIFVEFLGDWRKCCEQMPKIKILYTVNKSGKVTSPWGDNLDMYATKLVPSET